MNLDITFCSNTNCKIKKCERNQNNYNWNEVFKIKPYVAIGSFPECKYWG